MDNTYIVYCTEYVILLINIRAIYDLYSGLCSENSILLHTTYSSHILIRHVQRLLNLFYENRFSC